MISKDHKVDNLKMLYFQPEKLNIADFSLYEILVVTFYFWKFKEKIVK